MQHYAAANRMAACLRRDRIWSHYQCSALKCGILSIIIIYLRWRALGARPIRSANYSRKPVLPIRLRPDFSVVFEGYAGAAEHWPLRQEARKQSLRVDILRT